MRCHCTWVISYAEPASDRVLASIPSQAFTAGRRKHTVPYKSCRAANKRANYDLDKKTVIWRSCRFYDTGHDMPALQCGNKGRTCSKKITAHHDTKNENKRRKTYVNSPGKAYQNCQTQKCYTVEVSEYLWEITAPQQKLAYIDRAEECDELGVIRWHSFVF